MHDALREDPTDPRRLAEQLPGLVPSSSFRVPAQLRFLQVIDRAVDIALDGTGADEGCVCDLRLAVDEFAAVLIRSAATPSELHVTVTHDATIVHVRMRVSVTSPASPPRTEALTRLLLAATLDVHEIHAEGSELTAVMLRRLDSTPSKRGS